jgi:hypothetical protein
MGLHEEPLCRGLSYCRFRGPSSGLPARRDKETKLSASEGDARELNWLDQPGGAHEREDLALCRFERVRVLAADSDEQRSGVGIEGSPVGRRFRKGLTGCGEGRSDHQLDGRGAG